MYFVFGAGLVLMRIYAIICKEFRVLPCIMFIVYEATMFISVGISGSIDGQLASMFLNFILFLISFYLVFAVFSRKKLPLV